MKILAIPEISMRKFPSTSFFMLFKFFWSFSLKTIFHFVRFTMCSYILLLNLIIHLFIWTSDSQLKESIWGGLQSMEFGGCTNLQSCSLEVSINMIFWMISSESMHDCRIWNFSNNFEPRWCHHKLTYCEDDLIHDRKINKHMLL